MILYATYLLTTGQIVGEVTHDGGGSVNNAGSDVGLIEAVAGTVPGTIDPDLFYVDLLGKDIIQRPYILLDISKTEITADGKDVSSIKGVPNGAAVSIDGAAPTACTDGEIDFTATNKGGYTIAISLFPYLTKTVTVTAS